MTPREIIAQQEELITRQESRIERAEQAIELAKKRIKREKAEIALQELNKSSRSDSFKEFISDKITFYMDLLYFKYLHESDDSLDEESLSTQRYYIFYSNIFEKYDWYFTDDNLQVLPTVYFNRAKTAQECVDWLNAKETEKKK